MANKFLEKFFSPRKGTQLTLKEVSQIVESALKKLEIPVKDSKLETEDKDNSAAWGFGIENIEVLIYLVTDEKGQIYFKLQSPIVKMPKKNLLAFYRNLLERNLTLNELSIGINKDLVYIYGSRPTQGIDENEIAYLITELVSEGEVIAEELHEEFKAHYGTEE